MAVHGGNYKGWENKWKARNISGNTLWLDGDDPDYIYESSNLLVGWVDKSVNSWSPSTTTPTQPGVVPTYGGAYTTLLSGQEIAGESGWVKCTNIEVYGRHQAQRLNSFTHRNRIKVDFTYFVPIGSDIDGIYFTAGNNTGSHYTSENFEQGKIIRETNIVIDIRMITSATGTNDFGLGAIVGGNQSYTGTTDQIWYVKDYYEEVWDGNTFVQTTTAARPTYTPSTSTITFDGVQEYMDGSASIANFTGDTQGEIISVVRKVTDDEWAINFALGDSSTENRFQSFYPASNTAGFQPDKMHFAISSSITHFAFGDNTDTNFYLLSASSDDTKYAFYVNGGKETIDTINNGTDDGDWISSVPSIDYMYLSCLWVSSAQTYYNTEIKEIIYYNRQLTNRERRAIHRYLNEKYNIY